MVLSLVFIAVGFGASVWLYTVLHDSTSIVMMAVFLAAFVWYGMNVRNILRKKNDD